MMKRIFQILTGLIKNLKWEAVRVFASHPLFVLPTVWATIESVVLSEKNFDENPGGNGKANAYRHAVWNVLTAFYCSKISSVNKAVDWTEKITGLHEKLFPNKDYDREMDLHNNSAGRQLYAGALKSGVKTKKELLGLVMQKLETAVGLSDESEFPKYKNELVYYPSVG